MVKYLYFFSHCYFACFILQAQNLVLNPGFENFWLESDAPSYAIKSSFYCKDWQNNYKYRYSGVNYYLDTSVLFKYKVPFSTSHNNKAHSGKAFLGFFPFEASGFVSMQHISGLLKFPLEVGKEYELEFYLKYDESISALSLSKMEILFIDEQNFDNASFIYNDIYTLIYKKQRDTADLRIDISILKDSAGWIKFNKKFISNKNSKAFCIGLFYQGNDISGKMISALSKLNSSTSEAKQKKMLKKLTKDISFIKINPKYIKVYNTNYSYYYIDDISIIPVF